MRRAILASVLVAVAGCGGSSSPVPPSPNDELISGACGYRVRRGDTSRSVGFGGGQVSTQVTTTVSAQSSCTWSVSVSDAARAFITLIEPASGSSTAAQATVTVDVAPNSGSQRLGTVIVADVPFTITEAAAPCAFTLAGDINATFAAAGGTGRVTITHTQGAGCPWTAVSNSPFIVNVSPASGTDDGTVTFTVTANSGGARPGMLTIAGQTVTVTQAAINVVVPSITSVAPPTVPFGVTTAITVTGTGFDPATAQIAVTGPACPTTTSCVVANAEFTAKTPTLLTGPITLRNTGTFTLQVQNGSAGPLSNGVTINASATTTAAPVITTLSPTQATIGTSPLSIVGTGFDPLSARIVVTGPACPTDTSCIVANSELTTRTSTQLAGPATLLNAGTFTIRVQNGPGGAFSNGVTLTVNPPSTTPPTITALSPTQTTVGPTILTITGTGFDPSSAHIIVTGPACPAPSACTVANAELTSRTATQLVGPATLLNAGSFTIQVQNGSGPPSNGVTLTVLPPRTPAITGVSPTVIPIDVATSLTVTGSDFDPATAQIVVVGPACPQSSPCIVGNGELTVRSASQLSAPVTLRSAGSFTIQVRNGSAGASSNAVSVTVR